MPNSPVSYALPTRENLESDEDWSRISDRQKKKRVQNRVAQREYRRRTRELIEGLTAELDQYKRQAQETQDYGTQQAPSDEHTNKPTQLLSQGEVRESPAQGLATASPGQQIPPEQQQPSRPRTRQRSSRLAELPVSIDRGQGGEPAIACDPSSTSFNPIIQPSASISSSLSSLIPSSSVSLPQTHQGTVETSYISHPNTRQVPPSHQGVNVGRAAAPRADETWQTLLTEAAIQQTYTQDDNSFMPVDLAVDDDNDDENNGNDNDYYNDDSNDVHPENPPTLPMNLPSSPAHPGTETQIGTESSPWSRLPGAESSLEDRFDFLFDWVQHAGLGSLDNLLEVWYTGDFDDSSPLRQEQRLSRHRGLTALLAKLRVATHWSKWERWGYQQETLLGAESILRGEFLGLAEHDDFGRRATTLSVQSGRDKAETLKGLRRCLQGELPELRTLLAAVNADSSGKTGRQASRKAVDAAMICLSLIGRVSDADLLAILHDVVVAQGSNSTRPIHNFPSSS